MSAVIERRYSPSLDPIKPQPERGEVQALTRLKQKHLVDGDEETQRHSSLEQRSPELPQPGEVKTIYLKNKERKVVGSEAFNLEFDTFPSDEELRDHIVSYLGEYRLKVQKYEYELVFGYDAEGKGELALRGPDRGEPMRNKAKRVIEERTLQGKPIHREVAEDKGLERLEKQLHPENVNSEEHIFWASPPGPKDQGYGDYGFIFAGKVKDLEKGEKHLAMTAIRIEHPTMQQVNQALKELTGVDKVYKTAEDCLNSPLLTTKKQTKESIDYILKKNCSFDVDPMEEKLNAQVILEASTLIDEFVQIQKTGTQQEKVSSLHTLENWVLERKAKLKEWNKKLHENGNIAHIGVTIETRSLQDLQPAYGFKPPAVAGSCGSTESNNMVSAGRAGGPMIEESDSKGSLRFKCDKCQNWNTRPYGMLIQYCHFCGTDVGC